MEPHILDALADLHKQATTERSHYYVAKTCERAIAEIKAMLDTIEDLDRERNMWRKAALERDDGR